MIWVPCERIDSPEDDGYGGMTSYELVNPHPHLGADRPHVGTMRIEYNPIRNRKLGSGMVYWARYREGYSISLKGREAFLKDGSAVNRSILTSVGTSGIIPHRWCGPIVAVRERPFDFYEDITLADFRHVIDYVISYGTTEVQESVSHRDTRQSTRLRGVKICCYGEIKLHGSEPYVSVDVPRAHPTRLLYGEGAVSPISKLLGMPLKLWKYPDIDTWIHPPGWDESMTADSNQDAAFLMMETEPGKPDWGWAPPYWNMYLGNVLAVRADDKDLAVDDVRMMCYFTRRKLRPMFEDALGSGFVPRTKQEVLDFITWENMARCRDEMVEESGDSCNPPTQSCVQSRDIHWMETGVRQGSACSAGSC